MGSGRWNGRQKHGWGDWASWYQGRDLEVDFLGSRGHHTYPSHPHYILFQNVTVFGLWELWYKRETCEGKRWDGKDQNANSHHCCLRTVIMALGRKHWQKECVFQICHVSSLLLMFLRNICDRKSFWIPFPTPKVFCLFSFPPPPPPPPSQTEWGFRLMDWLKPHSITLAGLGVPL